MIIHRLAEYMGIVKFLMVQIKMQGPRECTLATNKDLAHQSTASTFIKPLLPKGLNLLQQDQKDPIKQAGMIQDLPGMLETLKPSSTGTKGSLQDLQGKPRTRILKVQDVRSCRLIL